MLRDLRLEQAHEHLLRADTSVTTTAEVAAECGFGRLGRVAKACRECYGEAPSQTLQRRAGAGSDGPAAGAASSGLRPRGSDSR